MMAVRNLSDDALDLCEEILLHALRRVVDRGRGQVVVFLQDVFTDIRHEAWRRAYRSLGR